LRKLGESFYFFFAFEDAAAPAVFWTTKTATHNIGDVKTPAKTNIRTATNPNPSCITSAAGVTPVTYKPGA
jgi:hypothetical protein